MTLYHFTSPKHIHGVLRDGLSMGRVLISMDPLRACSGYQWLTTNPDWEQSWNTMTNLDYDRTAYRLTISIPRIARSKLIKWVPHGKRMVEPHAWRALNSDGTPENWVLFKGVVRRQWFDAVDAKDEYMPVSLADAETKEEAMEALRAVKERYEQGKATRLP